MFLEVKTGNKMLLLRSCSPAGVASEGCCHPACLHALHHNSHITAAVLPAVHMNQNIQLVSILESTWFGQLLGRMPAQVMQDESQDSSPVQQPSGGARPAISPAFADLCFTCVWLPTQAALGADMQRQMVRVTRELVLLHA